MRGERGGDLRGQPTREPDMASGTRPLPPSATELFGAVLAK